MHILENSSCIPTSCVAVQWKALYALFKDVKHFQRFQAFSKISSYVIQQTLTDIER